MVTKSQTRKTSWRKKNIFSKRFTHQDTWTLTAQLSVSSLKQKMHYQEIAKMCEGVMPIHECEHALKTMENNKTLVTGGPTPEFYCCFWNLLGYLWYAALIMPSEMELFLSLNAKGLFP